MGANGYHNDIERILSRNVNRNGPIPMKQEGGPDLSDRGPCWLWTGYVSKYGYGEVKVERKHYKAHRYIYEQLVRHIPFYKHLHHMCENTLCVNPDHMEISNSKHCGIHNKRKTHCPHGHEYTKENTIIKIDKYNITHRSCRICYLKKQKEIREARKCL